MRGDRFFDRAQHRQHAGVLVAQRHAVVARVVARARSAELDAGEPLGDDVERHPVAERPGGDDIAVAEAGDAGMAPGFDRVLVDPPCSDLGALASRPDARWRKSPRMIERLARVQGQILVRGLEALRPGGTLVY